MVTSSEKRNRRTPKPRHDGVDEWTADSVRIPGVSPYETNGFDRVILAEYTHKKYAPDDTPKPKRKETKSRAEMPPYGNKKPVPKSSATYLLDIKARNTGRV